MRIGIIGIGNLGNSLVSLLKKNGYSDSLLLCDVKKDFAPIEKVLQKSEYLFLCVKPNDIERVLNDINSSFTTNKVIISCAAGISMDFIEEKLNYPYPVIRCMTNIPVSSFVYFPNEKINDRMIQNFLKMVQSPSLLEVKDEKMLDVSTILIGSMPAFISYLSQEILDFGIKNGFSESETNELYLSTVNGTIEMLKQKNTRTIIREVSSPGGVTEKGIQFLETSRIKPVLKECLEVSLNRISSLSKSKD